MFRTTDDFLKSIDKSNFSNSAVLIKGARAFNFEAISSALQEKAHQTVLEINLNALVSNLNTFKSLLKPTTKIMAMVKAFSYGSGTAEIANILQFHQIDYLAVAVADEGIELRKAGITTPIVVMNPEFYSFQNIIDYNLQPNIYSFSLFESFNKTLKQNAILNFPIHIKIETGMNRLGFKGDEEINLLIKQIKKDNTIKIKSVFSHLAGADDAEFDNFTLSQIKTFEKISQFILAEFEYKIDRHILNSAGIERFPNFQFEMVRLGIGLYGVSSSDQNLQAIGTLQTTISQIKIVAEKETIGYSRKGKINKPTQIAIIPIGYADGLNRGLGNLKGRVFINGNYAPIIGNICMDMCMLDVSGIAAKVGDKVEIFGEHVPISEIAQKLNTIPYEILTSISQRVKRIYLQE